MSTVTIEQVEPLFRQLPLEERVSLFIDLIQEAGLDIGSLREVFLPSKPLSLGKKCLQFPII